MAIVKCEECPYRQEYNSTDESYIVCSHPDTKSSWPLICPIIINNLKEGVYGKV